MIALKKALAEYLNLQRTLGFKLRTAGIMLNSFISFLKENKSLVITTKLALQWATQPIHAQPMYQAYRLCMVRHFAQYRITQDPKTEIPSQQLLPFRYTRKPPYLYTDNEIKKLLKAARELSSTTGLKPETYSTLFGLLATTGMRVSEAIHLNCADVDLTNNVIIVRESKFRKTRLVPIHPTTQRALKNYAYARNHWYPQSKSFFITETNIRLNYQAVRRVFIKLSRTIGFKSAGAHRAPHIHDLRHRFALSTVIRWYRTGIDVEKHLPKLSTYMGHVMITYTYWYLTAVPELLRLAAQRLDHLKGDTML
ncbi:MAG: tyrosine-type recombinase/integrase [bacterium]